MKTIALFGYYGVGNLGDEAVVSTLIRNIHLRIPDARIIGISLNPDDTRSRHRIEALPIRRMYVPVVPDFSSHSASLVARIWAFLFLKIPAEAAFMLASLRALWSIDAVIVAGSGGVYDWWHGAWTHPFTHYRWAIMCRLTHTHLVYLSVGAGPFKTRLGRWFFRVALSSASYRSFRDEESIRCMRQIGMRKPSRLAPDMAFDITTTAQPTSAPARSGRPMRVGLNALPIFHSDWAPLMEAGDSRYHSYIDTLAEFANLLIDRGCTPVFFHSQIGDGFLDDDIAAAIDQKRRDTRWRESARFAVAQTHDELMAEIAELDIVVASRFHAILFSYLLRKPVVGISYHHKIDDLMHRMGQSAYMVDIRALSFERLQAVFQQLEQDICSGAWSLHGDTFTRYKQELGSQFDEVFFSNAHSII